MFFFVCVFCFPHSRIFIQLSWHLSLIVFFNTFHCFSLSSQTFLRLLLECTLLGPLMAHSGKYLLQSLAIVSINYVAFLRSFCLASCYIFCPYRRCFRETCQWLKISPEWVTGPEQGKTSGRIATFSLWTCMFRDGISSIPGETVIPLWLGRHFLVCENRVYHKKVRMTVG